MKRPDPEVIIANLIETFGGSAPERVRRLDGSEVPWAEHCAMIRECSETLQGASASESNDDFPIFNDAHAILAL